MPRDKYGRFTHAEHTPKKSPKNPQFDDITKSMLKQMEEYGKGFEPLPYEKWIPPKQEWATTLKSELMKVLGFYGNITDKQIIELVEQLQVDHAAMGTALIKAQGQLDRLRAAGVI